MKKTTVTFSYGDEAYTFVEHVPAEVCPKMWEKALYAGSHGQTVAVCQTVSETREDDSGSSL
ncbi:MAG: YgiT-type zinc finger protein [Desulfobacteraceae bacterium]|uniref:YgiT-type zinc finger protein n=1 Tax=Candidatus Desulfacyla euxinica TaxID=2841693 RepID=A0A8J6T7Z6_9DELT|nr:YgiT-type zinc finger protein [Candidatus Desulfacyla euxinica]MBL6977495.1 YgiT-type zinc finger protein [Desulfobacteraceae bacterium]MBL7216241.1 YgiT-type zinc finger protein [Desulfobacteraceae bacterium]